MLNIKRVVPSLLDRFSHLVSSTFILLFRESPYNAQTLAVAHRYTPSTIVIDGGSAFETGLSNNQASRACGLLWMPMFSPHICAYKIMSGRRWALWVKPCKYISTNVSSSSWHATVIVIL